jgi:hypothetical protein
MLLDDASGSGASKRARPNRFEKVERAVVEFINSKSAEERSMITYDVLKNVASEVADRVLDDERRASFKISNGWIHGVLSRNHVVLEGGAAMAGMAGAGPLGAAGSSAALQQQHHHQQQQQQQHHQQQQQRVKRDLNGALKQVSGMEVSAGDLQLLGVSPSAAATSSSSSSSSAAAASVSSSSAASSSSSSVGMGPLQCDEEALALVDRLADYLRTRKVDDALILELDAFRGAFIAHTIASQSKLV